MSELKCCPFCGGETKYISFTQGLFIQRFVTCTKCGIETPRNFLNRKDAIKRWNTRTPMDNIVEKLEELKMRYFLTIANTGDVKNDFAYENVGNALDVAINIVKQEINKEN